MPSSLDYLVEGFGQGLSGLGPALQKKKKRERQFDVTASQLITPKLLKDFKDRGLSEGEILGRGKRLAEKASILRPLEYEGHITPDERKKYLKDNNFIGLVSLGRKRQGEKAQQEALKLAALKANIQSLGQRSTAGDISATDRLQNIISPQQPRTPFQPTEPGAEAFPTEPTGAVLSPGSQQEIDSMAVPQENIIENAFNAIQQIQSSREGLPPNIRPGSRMAENYMEEKRLKEKARVDPDIAKLNLEKLQNAVTIQQEKIKNLKMKRGEGNKKVSTDEQHLKELRKLLDNFDQMLGFIPAPEFGQPEDPETVKIYLKRNKVMKEIETLSRKARGQSKEFEKVDTQRPVSEDMAKAQEIIRRNRIFRTRE